MRAPSNSVYCGLCLWLGVAQFATAHDGPDPLMRWRLDEPAIKVDETGTILKARLGPPGVLEGNGRILQGTVGDEYFLEGGQCGFRIAEDFRSLDLELPNNQLTVSAWISVDRQERWGGILSVVQDNGDQEFGWVLGYDQDSFTLGLRSEDAESMTYLDGKTKYELGRMYHVVGIYDGQKTQLYVNGKLDAETDQQSGSILYPDRAPLMLGAYRDDNEFYGHRGRIREIALYDLVATPKWIRHEYEHHAALAEAPAAPVYEPFKLEIQPYLQFGTQTSMTVMWKTNRPAKSRVHYGTNAKCEQLTEFKDSDAVHEFVLDGLATDTQYFYRVESTLAHEETTLESPVSTFQTAVHDDAPFAFAVISDTQANPKVAKQLAEHAWEQRPNFLLHPGDLVDTGPIDTHWTEHFFPSLNPLIRRVPFFPVLGNHEQDAKNYYDYVSLPAPEYYYTFSYGNTQFFMIDSNRNVDPDSEQAKWLDEQLTASAATWKIVCHHHPPFSSDENDYGDLWKTNKSTRGDTRLRQLVPLYEKRGVDLVWNGHIHSYERTWPLRDSKAVNKSGTIYMITGGGGGSLETPGPFRPYFQNTVRRGHHYTMVRINGTTIEIQAYNLNNELFDQVTIQKEK